MANVGATQMSLVDNVYSLCDDAEEVESKVLLKLHSVLFED